MVGIPEGFAVGTRVRLREGLDVGECAGCFEGIL